MLPAILRQGMDSNKDESSQKMKSLFQSETPLHSIFCNPSQFPKQGKVLIMSSKRTILYITTIPLQIFCHSLLRQLYNQLGNTYFKKLQCHRKL